MQADFAEAGFLHLKDYWPSCKLDQFEQQVAELFHMQAMKIGEYRDRVDALPSQSWLLEVSAILEMMEQGGDKNALYQVQKFFPSCQTLRALFDDVFMRTCAGLLGSRPETTLIEGPALFVGRPNDVRLKYKPHSEAHYYPRRRRFVNVWLPLFADKPKASGTMSVWPGSHKREWPFAEYQGYDKDTEGKKGYFVQYEIPRGLVDAAGYGEHFIESNRGDLILFDRNLVHSSNINESGAYSFAVVARVWDPTDDLTLSGNMAVTPYGGDSGGRANLSVRS